ncbi:nuclear pore membrane glycoprotein 210 isoform X1 [Patella vulgata]|uniref:nuclear pore membrane glycoprotein 210 isoform X1 n=1 Tax=Patella vulgata TaxID=6465 RepID=UPI00217FDDFA|nr:nuclear pore membrane glycoprotein 210 isoform X1 [Patella vulgata]
MVYLFFKQERTKMAATVIWLTCFFLFVFLLPRFVKSAKLNTPKVLLPYYSTVISNFTLEVEFSPEELEIPNCYKWRTTRAEVAQVTLINSTDGECAVAAQVSAISKALHQMTTVVLAENSVTGDILRCDVIVSKIARLEVETTTRVLYLEDSPDELIAKGYDSDGNCFTSLDGFAFEWSLVSDTDIGHAVVDAHNILRIKRYKDSHYTTPDQIAPLEEKGLQGYSILVEGIRTGSAKVSTRLRDPVYKHLLPLDIRIMVIANLMLNPADVYVLLFSEVQYKVELLKHNKVSEITMPSLQYYIEVKDRDICTLETSRSVATALNIGSTEVVLKDKNIVVTEFFRQPSALFHVVNPSYLAFVVLPNMKWVLESNREYDILIEVYDTDSHKIFSSDNVRIEAMFPTAYFKVLFSSKNGTYHRVQTLLKGRTEIDGVLISVIKSDGLPHKISQEVKGSQEVDIYDPIIVEPSMLYFPWDPVTQAKHNYLLKARGGSGDYTWISADFDVTTVNIKGQITTYGMGRANITAADARNTAHTGTATIHVLPPNDMMFLPTPVEAVVGTILELPLEINTVYNGKKVSFTDCHLLNLTITFSDVTVFSKINSLSKFAKGCMSINVKALHQGHTEVTAIYEYDKIQLTASVTIAAFNPLHPVDPKVETVVSVSSSKDVIFNGGPQPWILDSSKYFQELSAARGSLLEMKQKTVRGSLHVFIVLCVELGEQELTLKVGNDKTARNQFPATQVTAIRFICARPVELYLQPILNFDHGLPPCPVTRETQLPIPVHCKKDLDVKAIVTDSSGRKFDNFSSLAIEWKVTENGLVTIRDVNQLTIDIQQDTDGKNFVTAYQTIHPNGQTGSVILTATITNYNQRYLKIACSSISGTIQPTISKSIELLLREEAVIQPNRVSVFNHPSNKVTIEVQKGSGYFYLDERETDAMTVKYDVKQKAILVNPLNDGSSCLTVFDLCLNVQHHPSVTIQVSGVGGVDVIMLDKVEVGKELIAKVQVLDVNGNPLLSSFFSLMGLKLEAGTGILTIRPSSSYFDDKVTAYYTVYGAYVGHTNMRASVKLPNGQVIYSSPKPVEVFSPLKLDPQNITLVVGSTFQVLAQGGPQPQSYVEFSVVHDKISTVTGGGLLMALEVGTAQVIGKAIGTHSSTGENIIYSQAKAIVNVVVLTGIKIYSPLTRIQTGTKMPVYAIGLTEQETPFTFGSAILPLIFTWSYNSREPIVLHTIYEQNGIKLSEESKFAMQLTAVEAGHVTLKLQVTSQKGSRFQIRNNIILKDELQIQVFEKLSVISPTVCGGQLLMTPNTETIVKTNRIG